MKKRRRWAHNSVDDLPMPVRARLDLAIAARDRSLTELAAFAHSIGAMVSRSAIHRYRQREVARLPPGAGSIAEAVRLYMTLTLGDRRRFQDLIRVLEEEARGGASRDL